MAVLNVYVLRVMFLLREFIYRSGVTAVASGKKPHTLAYKIRSKDRRAFCPPETQCLKNLTRECLYIAHLTCLFNLAKTYIYPAS